MTVLLLDADCLGGKNSAIFKTTIFTYLLIRSEQWGLSANQWGRQMGEPTKLKELPYAVHFRCDVSRSLIIDFAGMILTGASVSL